MLTSTFHWLPIGVRVLLTSLAVALVLSVLPGPPGVRAAEQHALDLPEPIDQQVGETLQFMQALSLQRPPEPSLLCRHVYVGLDEALDELVDLPAWHQLLQLYLRSTLPATLAALRAAGCEEDLHESDAWRVAGEGPVCQQLRNCGRQTLSTIEATASARAIVRSALLQTWLLHVRIGIEHRCLVAASPK